MVKGRKPKADAVRRKRKAPPPQNMEVAEKEAEVAAVVVGGLQKPGTVCANPTMERCWDYIVGDGTQYNESDIPGLEQMCYWYAVYQPCCSV